MAPIKHAHGFAAVRRHCRSSSIRPAVIVVLNLVLALGVLAALGGVTWFAFRLDGGRRDDGMKPLDDPRDLARSA